MNCSKECAHESKDQWDWFAISISLLALTIPLINSSVWAWPVALGIVILASVNSLIQNDQIRISSLRLIALQEQRENLESKISEYEQKLANAAESLDERDDKASSINEMLVEMLNKSDMELEDVGTFQQSLLPKKVPEFEGYQFAPLYQPSGWASGDYFDFIDINPTTQGVIVADVSGHGGRASVIMAIIRALMQIYAKSSPRPAKILNRMNVMMSQLIPTEDFVTVFYLIIDRATNKITYSSAGQPYAILINDETGDYKILDDANGIPVKLFGEFDYTENTVEMGLGDRLILFTDGVIEAQNNDGELYQMHRLEEVCKNSKDWPVQQQVELIQQKVREFVEDNPLHDDFTLMCIERANPNKEYVKPEQMETDLLGLDEAEDLNVEEMKLTDLPSF